MKPTPPHWVVFRRLALAGGIYALTGASLSLLGWITGAYRLTDWTGNGISIKPNTAVCIVTAAVCLLCSLWHRPLIALRRILAVFTLVVGGLTLLEHVAGIDFHIDSLLFRESPGAAATTAPGRMGPPAAICFTLLGLALFLCTGSARARRWASSLALLSMGIASLGLMGYVAGASQLYEIARLTGIAAQTVSMLLTLAVGTVLTVREWGLGAALHSTRAGGTVMRRLIVPVIFLPILIGWLRLLGQQAGLYDTAFGTAARTLVEISLLLSILWWASRSLNFSDAALGRERERATRLLASITDGFQVVDAQGRFVEFNDAARRMYSQQGVDPDGLIGKHIFKEAFPDTRDLPSTVALLRTLETRLPTYTDNYYVPWKRWFSVRHYPTDDGGVATFVVDITERKSAEESLRVSESRLRLFIEHAPAAIAMFDRNLCYLTVSQRWKDDYRLSTDLIGRCHYDVFPELPERWKAVHRRALTGEVLSADEDPFPRADGTTQFIKWEVRPWYAADGSAAGILVAAEDVSARVAAKQELRAREVQLRFIADHAPVFLVHCDAEARYKFVNRAYAERFGLNMESLVGKSVREVVGDKAYANFRPHVEAVLRGERIDWEQEVPYENIGAHWIHATYVPERDLDGTIVGFIAVIHDITARKQIEEAVRQSERKLAAANEQLSSRAKHLDTLVEQRTARLKEVVGELEAFSYSMAHDLRGPLRAMQGFANILEQDHASQLDDAARGYLRRISSAADRMHRLLSDVLSYTRITSEQLPLQPVESDSLIRDIIEQYPTLKEAQIRVLDDLPRVIANQSALTQVLSNLLTNAVKFAAPTRAIEVKVSAECEGDWVKLSVSDNGIGIAPEDQRRIFQMFERVHSNETYEGTGIGLAIVRRAVERMGGTCSVQSEPGIGSRFSITLKRAV